MEHKFVKNSTNEKYKYISNITAKIFRNRKYNKSKVLFLVAWIIRLFKKEILGIALNKIKKD